MNKSCIENGVWRSTVLGGYGKLLASCSTIRGSFCPPVDRVPPREEEKKRERGRKIYLVSETFPSLWAILRGREFACAA